ncbi:MAG TPA: zinc-binding dehydrogenase, partial [Cyclobacteriaceae bacterium]|nr:zinc-binding dehydrogenase [Cyclobacteriaceae bacterium]
MRAAYFKSPDQPLIVQPLKKPKPVKDQVLVRIHYAALNHRDLWVMTEQQQTFPDGIILGSDGSGVIESVGEDVDPLHMGLEVVINPGHEWGDNAIVQGHAFKILGFPDNGTFSDYVLVPKKYVFEKPEHLDFAQSAAVPLSGLTAYRALFSRARLRSNETVLITGIGGGAAQWLLKFAVAYKANVFVTSGSDKKIEKAKALGATQGYNYKDENWSSQALKDSGGFDIIIDSAGGSQFNRLIEIASPGGRIVNFGRTAGNITDINTRLLYWKQLSVLGSTMGTRDEFLSMLEFVEGHKLTPVIDKIFPLEEIDQAFTHMESGNNFGKIV